jgi:hypothetical protein
MFDFKLKLPEATGNSLANATTKIQEGALKVVNSLGGSDPFKKVAASLTSSINDGAAQAQQLIMTLRREQANPAAAALELAKRTATVEGSLSLNAMTFAKADEKTTRSIEPDVSAVSQNQAIANAQPTEHRVMLEELGSQNAVIFRIMPEIAESRTVKYDPVAPPQSPGAFQKYTGTDSVQWSINATLTCRTTEEATENLRIINQLRAWTMPYFGENTKRDYPSKIGAPPPVLRFSGFRKQMIGPVPVVLTSLNWQFVQDVDYIPARELDGGQLIPFPTVMKVALQLVESFSTDQFNGFDLSAFRLGNSEQAWMSRPGQGMNDSDGTGMQGGAEAPEEAQEIAPNEASRIGNAAPAGGAGGAGAGRGGIGGPTAEELSAYRTKVARDSLRGARDYGTAVTERATKFTSGGGGDFGGGGAGGGW